MNSKGKKGPDYHVAIQNVVNQLKQKRSELVKEITCDELEKAKVINEVGLLKDKLSIIDANLKKKSEFRKEYDRAINQSEENFVKLVQKSEEFLACTRREALALSQATGDFSSRQEYLSERKMAQKELSKNPKNSSCPPAAVLLVQPPGFGSCVGCSNKNPCTTIAVPYRANGL